MKNVTFRKNHTAKEKTLNYAPSSDTRFCKRCFKTNFGCQQPKGCPFDHRKENGDK